MGIRRNLFVAAACGAGGFLASKSVPEGKRLYGAAIGAGVGLATAFIASRPKRRVVGPSTSTSTPAVTEDKRVFVLPKSVMTSAAGTPTAHRTNIQPIVLPKSVISAAAQGTKFRIFRKGSLGPSGWLGCLLGYGLTIRLLSFKWLIWKRQLHPWDRFMFTGKTGTYWMPKRVEPPPPVGYWGGITPNYTNWIWNLRVGDKPFKPIVGMAFTKYPVYQQALGREYGHWSWGDHPEWGIKSSYESWLDDMERRADWTIKVPSWYRSEEKYLQRIKEYYANGISIVWAAAVYAIHARRNRSIPEWFQRHCRMWGIPFPSVSLRSTRRYFTDTDRFGPPVAPVSINGVGTGQAITDDDLNQLLSLVVHHTPPPGTVDPIPRPMHGSICDWPERVTGPMRPVDSISTPENWSKIISTRKERELKEGWQGTLSDVIPGIVSSIMSIAGGGLGSAAGSAASAAASLAGTAMGTALSAVVSAGISLCVSSAMAFAQEGRFDGELWKQIISVAVSEAGDLAANQTKGLMADKISSIETRTGWTFLEDTWGAGLEGETGALYGSLESIGQEGSLRRLAGRLGI